MNEKDLLFTESEATLRPKKLNDYIGKADIKDRLHVFIETAKQREETLDHVLLYGPPGLGKTTLACIIANEMGTNFKSVTAPSITRTGDLAAILSGLAPGDVLFIDEIHRLPKVVEETLYSAMEDFVIDIVVGKDTTAASIKINLPPFTLIGATTRCGDISSPLRDRFGISQQVGYYNSEELTEIVMRTAMVYKTSIANDAAKEIAKRSRGTPRVANRLFRRVRDYAQFLDGKSETISLDITNFALGKLSIDECGLNETDRKYLLAIIEKFGGGPAGLHAIASAIGEEEATLEDVYEPYLLQEGYITRSKRGRAVTRKAIKHMENRKNESK